MNIRNGERLDGTGPCPIDAEETMRRAAAMNEEVLLNTLRRAIRNRGGNVLAVLGREETSVKAGDVVKLTVDPYQDSLADVMSHLEKVSGVLKERWDGAASRLAQKQAAV